VMGCCSRRVVPHGGGRPSISLEILPEPALVAMIFQTFQHSVGFADGIES